MMTTGHEATTYNALRGTEVVMARRSFYVVEYVFADGSRALSMTFARKANAVKFAKSFRASNLVAARVMEGGAGGVEVARF